MIEYSTLHTFPDEQLPFVLGSDFKHKDIVMGAYFTGKNHPQHNVRVQPESFDYIAGWFHSCIRLGLTMVIFHDGLSEKFRERCQRYLEMYKNPGSAACLYFVECTPGPFTIADERFLIAGAFLERFHCRTAFMVDVSDAWFAANPAKLVRDRSAWNYFDLSRLLRVRSMPQLRSFSQVQRKHWEKRSIYNVFIGGETNTIGENKWMLEHFEKVYGTTFPELNDKPVLNCGIVGGTRDDLLALLKGVSAEMCRLGVTDVLNDMVVFNKYIYDNCQHTVYSNGVLNSPWKTWAKSGKHYIFHK